MTDDLVKRLRSPTNVFYEYSADDGAFLHEAANRIEELEAALKKIDRSECLHPHDIVEIARKALTGIDAEGEKDER